MTDSDDMGIGPGSQGQKMSDLKDHVSDRAVDVAQKASKTAGEVRDTVSREVENTRDRISSATDDLAGQANRAYGRASEVVRSGYDSAAGQVAASPMSSLLIAAAVGLGVGWALRGQHEDDRRTAWLNNLPDSIRRRLG